MGEGIGTQGAEAMASEQQAVAISHAEQLEEIARRLVELHVSVASNIGSSIEHQRWQLAKLRSLMEYVDEAIDRHVATR